MPHASGNPQPLPPAPVPARAPDDKHAWGPAVAWLRAHWRDPLYRNSYFLMLNSASAAGFGFLFWMVVARLYDRDTVGWGVGVVSAMTLAALLGKFGVDAALIRYVPPSGERQRRKLLLGSLALSTGFTLALATTFLYLFPRLLPALAPVRHSPLYALLFCAFAASMSASWVMDGYFIAERRASLSFLRNLIMNGLKLGVPFLGVVAASRFGIPFAWGVGIAASLVVAFAVTPGLWRRARPENGPLIGRRAFMAYAGVNYVVNVSEWLPSLMLPLIVIATLGTEANATFYMAWTLASLAFFLTKAISQSTFAEMSHEPETLAKHLRKGAVHAVMVVVPFLIGGFLFGDWVLSMFGPEYREQGYPVLVVLLSSSFFVAVTNLYLTLLKALDARWELILLPATLLSLSLVGAEILLEPFGLLGLAAAWFAANLVIAAYALLRIPGHLRRSSSCRIPAPPQSA